MTLRELKNTLGECADDDTLDLAILERDMIRENVQMLEYLVKQLTDPDEGLVKLYGDKVLKGVSAKYAQLVWVAARSPPRCNRLTWNSTRSVSAATTGGLRRSPMGKAALFDRASACNG